MRTRRRRKTCCVDLRIRMSYCEDEPNSPRQGVILMRQTTVPVNVAPEAAERIAELDIQVEVDRMIDHAVKTVRGIRRVEIELMDPYEMYDEPHLSARAYRDLDLWGEVNPEVTSSTTGKSTPFRPP